MKVRMWPLVIYAIPGAAVSPRVVLAARTPNNNGPCYSRLENSGTLLAICTSQILLCQAEYILFHGHRWSTSKVGYLEIRNGRSLPVERYLPTS